MAMATRLKPRMESAAFTAVVMDTDFVHKTSNIIENYLGSSQKIENIF